MTLNNSAKYWLANNAGSASFGGCFVASGITYTDPDGAVRTGGTGDVANAFFVAHLIGKDTVVIIASTNYTQLKAINGAVDLVLDDVAWVYINTPAYCAPTTGSASFTSTPSVARIWVDSIDKGVNTPNTITGLAPGSHTYKLVLAGYTDVTGNFTVTEGYTIDVPVVFMASASFTSTPSGARIWIDTIDKLVSTPNTITGLTAGVHTYKLVLAGYADITGSFTATAGQTISVPVVFMASASFTSTPSVARIWIDGVDQLVNTPYTIVDLTAGSHTYTLKLTGYADSAGSFTATAGTTTVVPLVTFMASASFTSTPSGARIWIDSIDQLVNIPYTITGLTPGSHTYTLKLLGYVDLTGSFTATAGTTTVVPTATLSVSICSWISGKGGPTAIVAFDIMTLVSAYSLVVNLGFTVGAAYIMGAVAYYSGNNTSGNSLTGCAF